MESSTKKEGEILKCANVDDDAESSSISSPSVDENDPRTTRDRWPRRIDFFLACVGFCIGFGNVWRFPYLAYKNGGGTFVLIYLLFAPLAGVPLYFLETSLGQFMTSGTIGIWRICPLFKGIGVAQTSLAITIHFYYNIILAWCFYYLFSSFQSPLPWATCDNDWNIESQCSSVMSLSAANRSDVVGTDNRTNVTNVTDAATQFWENNVLQISNGIDEASTFQWKMALCIVFTYIIVFLCIVKGIRTSGKVMYVTATSPYILMVILLVYGLTLPGAAEGVAYYLTPRWDKLWDYNVWIDAATQLIYSYGVCIAALPALGSFNPWHRDSYRDSLLFSGVDAVSSLLAGLVIFPFLGHMAHEQNLDITQVAEQGPGLVFVIYPKAVTLLPAPWFWSILFFIMLIMVGLDSVFVEIEGIVTTITDEWKWGGRHKVLCTFLFVVINCAGGMLFVLDNGIYVFTILDTYAARLTLVICFFECIVVAYVYGAEKYYDNLQLMYGYRISPYMKICWRYITPAIIAICFVFNFMAYESLSYKFANGEVYEFPTWSVIFGWLYAAAPLAMIPLVAAWQIFRTPGDNISSRIRTLVKPKLLPYQEKAIQAHQDEQLGGGSLLLSAVSDAANT